MLEIYERRLSLLSEKKCKFFRESDGSRLNFLFNIDGQPLGYRQIQYRYNKALKKAGLYPTFSATHILRKAMANIVRQNMGLDAAQAVGGWKSREVVEKVYTDEAPAELNKLAVNTVASLLKRDDNKPKAGTKLRLIKD
jgi:integrase